MPESLIFHLLAIFCDVADADASDFPHVLGRELERVSGTAVEEKFVQGLMLNS